MASANESLLESNVRHQVYLQRYSTTVVKKIIKLLNAVDEDLVAQILKRDPTDVTGAWSRKRLERLLEEIRQINKDAYKAILPALRSELRELALYETEFTEKAFKASIPIDLNIIRPSNEMLFAIVSEDPFQGQLLKEWVKDLEAHRLKRIKKALRIALVEGETIDQMVRRIRGTRSLRYNDGILDASRRDAEALVRTAVNHVTNAARSELYNVNDNLVKGIKWVSTLDGRTSAVCRARDGKVYALHEGPRPPAHINCRSTTTPILKSWEELGFNLNELSPGQRASMNGSVPEDLTYGPFLRKQPREFVEDVMGKTKARLFLDGKLKIDRFVNNQGREFTLDELRQREGAAFTAAEI